jgi:hypothetical protein
MSVEQERQDKCEEEEEGVHDSKHPARFEHGAGLVEIHCETAGAIA